MSLRKYNTKRDFKKTAEPRGKTIKNKSNQRMFVIQKHAASHLHYDFRLELDGVLKSWAVPKGPSLDPTVKRLAVHVEDHPISYGSFEGVIPKGEYGGGTVMLWDTGTWECLDENPKKAYEKGDLKFKLQGKKLKGLWKLIRIKSDPKNWLLIKAKDKYVNDASYDITNDKNKSVTSHKTLEKIGGDQALLAIDGKKAKIPESVSPELAMLSDQVPEGRDWLHEIKFDGYRLLTFINKQSIKFLTRNKNDWTAKFSTLKSEMKTLNIHSAIFDGEIVALDDKNQNNFQLLQNSIHNKDTKNIRYYIFDILYVNGKDLQGLPLIQRKKILKDILGKGSQIIQFSDHIQGDGKSVYNKSCQLKLEGIISKKANSTYIQKRTSDWLKVKCHHNQEFIICGFTKPKGKRSHFGSIILGANIDGELVYCGHVGTGFTQTSLQELHEKFTKYITPVMPFKNKPPVNAPATWLQPKLVAEIEFAAWTEDKVLRHASFKGLRGDKPAKKVVIEQPINKSSGVILTNPERVLYPSVNITKLDLANYYEMIQSWILPHIIERPLTLLRCPRGFGQQSFYQRHVDAKEYSTIYSIDIKQKDEIEPYLYIKDLDGLIQLVQLGCLEIHPWSAKIDKIDKPDLIIFDLDPGPNVAWKEVVAAAKYLREELQALKLDCFVKTTGSKGLHIQLPIKQIYTWDEVKAFSHAFVDYIVSKQPNKFIGVMSKAKRDGKIFIDYLRNQKGATAIAPYSTRAKEGAPVATPLTWDELSVKIKPDQFNVKNLMKRLKKLKIDPWAGYFSCHQKLPLKSEK